MKAGAHSGNLIVSATDASVTCALVTQAFERAVVCQDTAPGIGFNREKVLYSAIHRIKTRETQLYTQSRSADDGHKDLKEESLCTTATGPTLCR
jgi:hypothetical protein